MAGILDLIPLVIASFLLICDIIAIGLSAYFTSLAIEPYPIYVGLVAVSTVVFVLIVASLALPGIRPLHPTVPSRCGLISNVIVTFLIFGLSVLNVAFFGFEYIDGWTDYNYCGQGNISEGDPTCQKEKALQAFTVLALVLSLPHFATAIVRTVFGFRNGRGKTFSKV